MKAVKFVKKIRNYAIASFLIPLIAINACLLVYKFFGNMKQKPSSFFGRGIPPTPSIIRKKRKFSRPPSAACFFFGALGIPPPLSMTSLTL